ncbi:hypothetical protein [Ichthyenterobacterium magnum]|uniref:Uncharacterized protein n=1 Tax=Ichthyenterobacterium magnum TaxID=1230530 RepID=A0A420DL85_9FLAO|nr:hypothetical protein [Ichthyenterobacterium magnum]RKE94951.1 hypothetical protein BXY80_1968 [Ichthyenterobacterium magnum]
MKTTFNLLKAIIITFLIIGCSGDDDSNSIGNTTFGTIQLSGLDTAIVGSTLVVGNIDPDGLDTTGTNSSVTLLDKNTTIENGEVVSTDFLNAFVIVAAQFTIGDNTTFNKAISMLIAKDGEEFSYVCSTPPSSSADNTDCGTGFSVDKVSKTIVFDDTTVINTDSGAILTMNGTINY